MKKTFLKFASTLVSTAVLISAMSVSVVNAATGIAVNSRTPEEIAEYINSHPVNFVSSNYTSQPDYTNAPYNAGALNDETLQDALNALNTVRFIAGIDEVALSDNYNELAQAGCLVNAVNDDLSHDPPQPTDMPDELYQKGYEGVSSSNIGWNHRNLASNILNGWMSDASSSNISRVGHRRWCLNPSMEYTGFGHVGAYTAMYSFDNIWEESEYYGVCWPAQVMPEGYFGDNDPWSISMGYAVDSSAVEVELVRLNDGTTWNFSESSADGFFNVENSNYGKKGCIIFRPDYISYNTDDCFEVTITGLDETVNYTVDFVDVFAEEAITADILYEIVNFVINNNPDTEKVYDLNYDETVNVFDVIYAKRNLN